jgi:hypothetical protein
VRSEQWWRIRLADGTTCVLARLLPELARDESLRRRYVRDAERRAALETKGLAPVIAIGPLPDPRDPSAEPPWRLRVEPQGERLSDWLDRRAPAPVDEVFELVAQLADLVHGVHQSGSVLRDLEPRNVIIGTDGELWLTDIGLARVDILSTRSASSLMLESSPYAAPEHLRATVIDHRADLYTLGAILWEGLTGVVPFADGGLFRERVPLPPLADMGANVLDGTAELVAACLAARLDDRPESARLVAECLRGAPYQDTALAVRVVCQACGEAMLPGLRLCLACGKEAVQFSHLQKGGAEKKRYRVLLKKATEDAAFLAKLRAFFETVGEGPVPELNFLIGDARMYSKEERARLHKLPATLITDVSEETAKRLADKLEKQGFKVKTELIKAQPHKRHAAKLLMAGAATGVGGGALIAGGAIPVGVGLLIVSLPLFLIGAIRASRKKKPEVPPLAGLRSAPAALPASDPLVAQLGALLADNLAADIRERVSEIALLVQHLVDHRGRNADQSGELAMITEPIEPLVALVCREVDALLRCDEALVDLDEGQLVRAIATSEARREPRSVRLELMAGLDRLRELEDDRATHMQHLLEATSLIRRAVELGLSQHSDTSESDRYTAMALAALGD